MTKEEIIKPENLVYKKPTLMNDNPMHYCPGCSHGVVHKLVAEVIEEMGLEDKAIGISPVGCAVFIYNYLDIDWQEAAGSMLTISLGITVIFAIYFTYYFTEALIMESNIQEKSAVTRNYQMTWLILSAAVFAHFMIFGSTISLYSILVEALVGICALYYCFTVYSSSKQLYED